MTCIGPISIFILFLEVTSLNLQNAPTNEELMTLFKNLTSRIDELQREVTLLKAKEPAVAFYARLWGSQDIKLGYHQAVIFDKVVTNLGNGYDIRHGHFTAPVKGLYHFGVTVMGKANTLLYLEVVKNGVPFSALHAEGTALLSQTEVSYVVLEAGDMVWVREPDQLRIGEIIHGSHGSFTGSLVSTDV